MKIAICISVTLVILTSIFFLLDYKSGAPKTDATELVCEPMFIDCDATERAGRPIQGVFSINGRENFITSRISGNHIGQNTFNSIRGTINSNTNTSNMSNWVFEFECQNNIDFRGDSMVVEITIKPIGNVVSVEIIETTIQNTEFTNYILGEIKSWRFFERGSVSNSDIPDGIAIVQHTFRFGAHQFSNSSRCRWLQKRPNVNKERY